MYWYLRNAINALHAKILPTHYKITHELSYWTERWKSENECLLNSHYEHFYTEFFCLSREDYVGKKILDVACGPRGSLEWAEGALERVGLDSLVGKYRKFGIDKHNMSYVKADVEKIPFPNENFDYVTSFNSLDHVNDVEKAADEIVRVLKMNATFLLITEINHKPTPTEPQCFSEEILDLFTGCGIEFSKLYEMRKEHDIYGSVQDGIEFKPKGAERPAILCAKLRRFAIKTIFPLPGGNNPYA